MYCEKVLPAVSDLLIIIECCSVHAFNEAEGCNYTNYSVCINTNISCVAYRVEFEKSWPMAAEPSKVKVKPLQITVQTVLAGIPSSFGKLLWTSKLLMFVHLLVDSWSSYLGKCCLLPQSYHTGICLTPS